MSCGSYPAGLRGQDWMISWNGGEARAMPKLSAPVDPAPHVEQTPRVERFPLTDLADLDAVVTRPSYTSLIVTSIILIIFAILYNRVRMRTMWQDSKPDETGTD